MFVIVHNNLVIKGPNDWNKLRFEEVLREECEVTYTLETRNDSRLPVIVSSTVKILPVTSLPEPSFNSRTQFLNGPFWNLSNTSAQMYYTAQNYNVEAVKTMFMSKVTSTRYDKENAGTKTTIQGMEVTLDTARGSRDIFVQAYMTMADTDTVNWKFPEGWLTISKAELGTIIALGRAHIQSCFDWENNWLSRVQNATTLTQLNTFYDELEAEITGV